MLAYFSRQRVVGAMIMVLACALCVTPLFSRGKDARAASGLPHLVGHVVHYPPAPSEQAAPPAPGTVPASVPPPAPTGVYVEPIPTRPAPPVIGPPPYSVQPPSLPPQPAADQIVESKSFALVSTKYRLSAGKAKALAEFLEAQVGRPEIFEISVDEAEAITVIASPAAQKTVAELVGLMRTSPGKPRETHPPCAAKSCNPL
jgi:hypothetical protein